MVSLEGPGGDDGGRNLLWTQVSGRLGAECSV